MSDIFGNKLEITIKCKKNSTSYSVTITKHGEKMGCTEIDSNGENINAKIVEYISSLMSGKESEEASLTKEGQIEHRVVASKHRYTDKEDEEEYDHLSIAKKKDPYDNGYGF